MSFIAGLIIGSILTFVALALVSVSKDDKEQGSESNKRFAEEHKE